MNGGNQPSVSIVLATHNRPEWLRIAMDSVLGQDYPDLELLVMDDGSTDSTPDLLADYSRRHPPERFRHSSHENMGQARTLNRGYEVARGEILGYLSDDDLLAPGAVSRLVAEMTDPDVVVAYPGYRMIDTDGQIVDTIRPIEYSPTEAFRLHDTIIGPAGLVRRGVLESAGGWDPSLHWMGDLILWMRVGLAGRVVRVPEPLASWRRHPEGITTQTSLKRAREHLRLVELGASLLQIPADAVAMRAEALRNACTIGAFFGGSPGAADGPRVMAIDLQRPQISAFGAGLGQGDLLDERAAEAARLWRELARLTVEVAGLRARDRGIDSSLARSEGPEGAGLETAMERLRSVGALPAEDGAAAPATISDQELNATLWQAALDLSPDVDIDTTRYLLIDQREGLLREDEATELTNNSFHSWVPGLRSAIERRRQEIESLAG